MKIIDKEIINIDNVICNNINRFDITDRGLLSQNILSQLRNFVEVISLKEYSQGQEIGYTYKNITEANNYVKSKGNLKFLSRFHKLLQITASHYTLNEENSERLMLKYYEYLLKIKSHLKDKYNLDVLKNINTFPINTDTNLKEYYEKIVKKISEPSLTRIKSKYNSRYYIQKVKPFFLDNQVYYEVTFTDANDKASKFDRIIAFTKLDISHNYAVKFSISSDSIEILGKSMPIQIIDNWEVSIRPCELKNFGKIFNRHFNINTQTLEYLRLMDFLTKTGLNLVEFIDFDDHGYENIKNNIIKDAKTVHFFNILDNCRKLTKNNMPGRNVVRYLLYKLNNKIIKNQYDFRKCELLSNLNLDYGCIPFEQIPFNSSLKSHNPRISDIFYCIDASDRKHEIFARVIKNNTEIKGQLYTTIKEVESFDNIDELIKLYNDSLYYKHKNRELCNYRNHIYIKGYEDNIVKIINKFKGLSSENIGSYENSVKAWLSSSVYSVDCEEKKVMLGQLFENSKVALIYGSAGSGKSTIINHISHFFNDKTKLYLTNTNPAIDNLKRKVDASNCTFKTISKFINKWNNDKEYDLLFIDESSTVSNSDMLEILNKASFKLLVLVGDVFQIESILFGNWFYIAQSFVPKSSIFELTKPYRSKSQRLLNLWDEVRIMNDNILEHITKNNYSVKLDKSIFECREDDEIILCLNYDGLYGINNINKFLQSNNDNASVQWGIQTYKINDPILFNETDRFSPLIYNNLKGKIVNIKTIEKEIKFDIEIDKIINQFDANDYDFQLIGNSENGNSIIRFSVSRHGNTDEDDDSSSNNIVPFQIAYAVSIHKAQGLEYNSVKIVITDEVEEMITHNIFYTAITRAKEKLKIYWTPETENKVLSSMKIRNNKKDVALLTPKFNL